MINITVTGGNLNVDVSAAIKKSLHQSSQLVRGEAIKNAPVLTGTLRRSITTKVMRESAIVGTNVRYARKREYSNRKNPHTKFYMKRALNDSLLKIQKFFYDNLMNLK